MLHALPLVTTLYLNHYTGQIAGMNNVVLEPAYSVGVRSDFTLSAAPSWRNSVDVYGIMGKARSGLGTTGSQLQEVRAKATFLYNVYSNEGLTMNTGLYSLFAFPVQKREPLLNPQTNVEYAAEENEKVSNESLLGLDLNLNLRYDKLESSFHNVFYFHGKRIAPNLLGYVPVLGFDWRQEIYLAGDVDQPKFSFFANVQFWFARKAHGALINAHDGLGATKRELLLEYGLKYYLSDRASIYLKSFGYNNLNRGYSQTDPKGFRDGSVIGASYSF